VNGVKTKIKSIIEENENEAISMMLSNEASELFLNAEIKKTR